MQKVGSIKEVISDPEMVDAKRKRLWLLQKGLCCGICPNMMCARKCTTFLDTEVMCEAHGGDSVTPKAVCGVFAQLTAEDMRSIDPMLIVAARQFGVSMPAGLLAA